MNGRLDHERAPIYETLTNYVASGIYGFHTPGHKWGRFAAPELTELVGRSGLALDLPSMTATDNTFHPTHCVRDARRWRPICSVRDRRSISRLARRLALRRRCLPRCRPAVLL